MAVESVVWVDERQGKDVSSAKSQLRRRFHLVSRLSEGPVALSASGRCPLSLTLVDSLEASTSKALMALVLSLSSPSPRQRVMVDPATMLVFHLHAGKH
jgi:hypothetical protein